jgi:hypothetical protein
VLSQHERQPVVLVPVVLGVPAEELTKRGFGALALDGNITSAGANRVHIDINGNPGLYKWQVSGRLLTLTKISDPIQDRAAVFWGVWKRK